MNSPTLMRVFTVILAVGFLLQAGPAMAEAQSPKNLRVCVQYIEMPHTALTELMSGKAQPGHVLHEKAMAMTKEGKAKLLESSIIMAKSGMQATITTASELIFPTEYTPPCLPTPQRTRPVPPSSPQPRPPFMCPTAFETRYTGLSFEVVPTFDVSTNLIDLRILPENVDFLDFWTISEYRDQWGDASIRKPTFETWRTNTELSLQHGKFDLAATITPRPADPVPATLRKILVFIRCDVIPVIPRP